LKENDGRDAGSRRRAACFGSLTIDFVDVLGPASGRGVMVAILGAEGADRLRIAGGFGADSEDDGARG
jgi:hypothetical protein